jgi:hypothetical protein
MAGRAILDVPYRAVKSRQIQVSNRGDVTLQAKTLTRLPEEPIVFRPVGFVAFQATTTLHHVRVGAGVFIGEGTGLVRVTVLADPGLFIAPRSVRLSGKAMTIQTSHISLAYGVLRTTGKRRFHRSVTSDAEVRIPAYQEGTITTMDPVTGGTINLVFVVRVIPEVVQLEVGLVTFLAGLSGFGGHHASGITNVTV